MFFQCKFSLYPLLPPICVKNFNLTGAVPLWKKKLSNIPVLYVKNVEAVLVIMLVTFPQKLCNLRDVYVKGLPET